MATTERAPAFLSLPTDASAWSPPWGAATLAWQQGLITLLDLQTAWWKDTERQAAAFMRAWMAPAAAATPLALLPGWQAWARVWADALQHDAEEQPRK
jgi:hypothetical protein